MQSKYSNAPLPNSGSFVQPSPLAGFQFSTIGQHPSLLERMSDTPFVSFRPPSDQNPSQEQDGASPTHSHPGLPQPSTMGPLPLNRGRSVKPIPIQRPSTLVLTPTPLPSESPNDVKLSQPLDQIRASVFPDLQYPTPTPGRETPLSESHTAHPQFAPNSMDQDQYAVHSSQPSVLRSPLPLSAVNNPRVEEIETPDGSTDGPTFSLSLASSQHSTSAEHEPVRRPVEHLFELASLREEHMLKRRVTFDLRSSELSTLSAEALQAVRTLQDNTESLKQQAEEMRAQAEQTLQEANKMRELADRLIASAGTFGADVLGAKVGRAVERSEQMTRFMHKNFDWLATLRTREQEKIALVQAEIAEQDLAELTRRQQEIQLQQQLQRRKIEEQEKKEAARREEEREAVRKRAEEEAEVARKRAEEAEVARKRAEEAEAARKRAEEAEAARRRSYEMRRAEVLAEKRRATEAHAQSIQAGRERKFTDTSGSTLSSIRGSNAPVSVSPALSPELPNSAGVPTSASFSLQRPVPAPSRSPVAKAVPDIIPPLSHPPQSNKVKAAPSVSFVPAQTEAGRAVNVDLPLSSTTLASELHMRDVAEASQHAHLTHTTRDALQEQIQSQSPWRVAPILEPHLVKIKREPSVEKLPAQRLEEPVNADQPQHRQQVVTLRTASHDMNIDQYAPTSSTSDLGATPLHDAQTEDHRRRTESGTVPPEDNLGHPHGSLPDHVLSSADGRAYGRRDSVSSDESVRRWNDRDRRSPSPLLRERWSRSRSRSPSYPRKRTRSRTPLRYEPRHVGDHWESDRPRLRPRIDDDWDTSRRYNYKGYDRGRQNDRYRAPPPRRRNGDTYRPSHSPPPSPRHFRNDRSPPRRSYRERSLGMEHYPPREQRVEEYRTTINARYHEADHEGAEARRSVEREEQPRWQQQRQWPLPSTSERDQSSTPPPRPGEVEAGLLDRIDMKEAHDRGRGRGRPHLSTSRGGPNTRRGMRGGYGSSRGRGGVSGPAPALLSRMTETTTRPARTVPATLSDRMQQD
ncbi:hypothetical protein BC826DRAFT_972654 [Russula brevipes]|nr:hypothetical protein BC826DRAFT_972654 [Russula brevipes]